jgi:fluoride exporter
MNTLLIFIGAGFGGVSRFLTSKGLASLLGQNFPYGTLAVNVLGSFIMGFLYVLILDRLHGIEDYLRPLILTGFLGGFTTFSSFSIETLVLFENGSYVSALANVLLNVVLCLLFVWLGVLGGRQL